MSDDTILTPEHVQHLDLWADDSDEPCELSPAASKLVRQLCASHEASRAQLAALGQGWQPIETAPKDGTAVLMIEGFADTPFIGRFQRVGQPGWFTMPNYADDGVFRIHPTHWHQLPDTSALASAGARETT